MSTMPHVKIFDFVTRKTSTIPASELAPGMILANVKGVGEVYVRANDLEDSSSRKELPQGFAPIALAVLDLLRPRLTHIDSTEEWLDGFRADAYPVHELLMWMGVATVYHEMTHDGQDNDEVARDVFRVLLSSMNDSQHPLETVDLARISHARAKTIVARHQSEALHEDLLHFWAERIDLEVLDHLVKAEGSRESS